MSSGGLEQRPESIRMVLAWTLGPLALVILAMGADSFLHVHPQTRIWLAVLALLTACVGQSLAFTKARAIGKGQSIAARIVGFLCTLVSCILLLLWIVWLAISSYYAFHPNAPPLYGRS